MALARALAVEPQVLLLDEPFGALDARVREELRAWLRRLHDEVHVTTLFVTHDQEEAMEIAEQIVVINEGRVEQSGGADGHLRPPGQRVRDVVRRPGHAGRRPARAPARRPGARASPARATQPAEVTRLVRLGFEVRVELTPAEGPPLSAQLSRAEAELLELAEGQIVHVRVEPVTAPAA